MSESTSEQLTLEKLRELVAGKAVAIRGKATLVPAGGPGDKVFPPTHSVDERNKDHGAKYAFERRRISSKEVDCVLLDSVQSQANRMEEALQALWEAKKIRLPVIQVDFSGVAPDVGKVTSLSAPHRVADALLRDSLLGEQPFRLTELGRSFSDASVKNAGPLFKVCPTGLVFGIWDSTGPKGGLGAKFARALVSEIVGVGVVFGAKTASRIDPAGIVNKAGPIFVAKQPGPDGKPTWALDVMEAKPKDAKSPPKDANDADLVEKWGKKDKAGKPTAINHSNFPPTIDVLSGGVTFDHAVHTVVLSFAAIRKLRFGTDADDKARTVLAALGLLAVLAAERQGHDLRSRCLLVPRSGEALKLEVVLATGETKDVSLDLEGALTNYKQAVEGLPESLRFAQEPGVALEELTPSPKLAELVRKSRELASVGEDVDEET